MTASVVGIDLAWSSRNLTGVAIGSIELGEVVVTQTELARDLSSIVDRIASLPPPVTIAIDAPTIVPNESGMRECERLLQRQFGAFGAGPFPGNRRLLGKCNGGTPRGTELIALLGRTTGALEVGLPPAYHAGVYVMEVFPAPALYRLFGRVPRYKKKPARTWESCRAELGAYLDLLTSLKTPCLRFPTTLTVSDQRGVAFKGLEDQIDAVLCAYLAALAWSGEVESVGTIEGGYVVLPAAERRSREDRALVDGPDVGLSEE